MSMQNGEQGFGGFYQSSSLQCSGPYEPSIASSASSSQASIFSEACSLQSSIASSISDDFRQNQEEARDRACAQLQIHSQASLDSHNAASKLDGLPKPWCPAAPSYADVTSVPKERRQHPRRNSLAKKSKTSNTRETR